MILHSETIIKITMPSIIMNDVVVATIVVDDEDDYGYDHVCDDDDVDDDWEVLLCF